MGLWPLSNWHDMVPSLGSRRRKGPMVFFRRIFFRLNVHTYIRVIFDSNSLCTIYTEFDNWYRAKRRFWWKEINDNTIELQQFYFVLVSFREIYQTLHAPPFTRKSWEGTVAKCAGERHAGDYNGDGFEDILCVDKVKGSLQVIAGEGGSFASTPIWSGNLGAFCNDGTIKTAYGHSNRRKNVVCLHDDGRISAKVHVP